MDWLDQSVGKKLKKIDAPPAKEKAEAKCSLENTENRVHQHAVAAER